MKVGALCGSGSGRLIIKEFVSKKEKAEGIYIAQLWDNILRVNFNDVQIIPSETVPARLSHFTFPT